MHFVRLEDLLAFEANPDISPAVPLTLLRFDFRCINEESRSQLRTVQTHYHRRVIWRERIVRAAEFLCGAERVHRENSEVEFQNI